MEARLLLPHPSLTYSTHRADNHFVWVKSLVVVVIVVIGRFYTVICYLGTHCAQTSGVPIKSLCFIDTAAAFDFQLVGGWDTTDPTSPHTHPALRSPAQAENP